MAQQPSTTLAVASDGTDLIPGSQRGVTAINDALGAGAASVADTAAALARTATSLVWSGPAADAFSEYRRAAIDHTDLMGEAVEAVRIALDGHLDALGTAQGFAGDALDLWHNAEQQLRVAKQYDTPEANLASNAATVRAQAVATAVATAKRAQTLLNQARQNLARSGERAETNVRAALDALRAGRLPTLDLNAGSAGSSTPAGSAAMASAMTPPWTPPGWSGPTATVAPPADGVHDSLSRIAQRVLGDANRWPEIYQLNVGQPVGPHAVLTDPSLIQPGWVLRLPDPPAITPPLPVLPPAQPVTPPVATSPVIHHSIPVLPHAGTSMPAPVNAPPSMTNPVPPTASTETAIPGAPSGPALPPPMSTVGPPDTTDPTTPTPIIPPSVPLTPALPLTTTQPHPGHAPTAALPPARPGSGLTTAPADHGVNAGDGLILAGSVVGALVLGVGAVVGVHHLRKRTNGASVDTPVPADVASHGDDPDHGAPVIRRLTAVMPSLGNGASGHAIDIGPNGPIGPSGPDSIWVNGAGPARLPFGERDGKTVLYDVAATLGLGLVGPGAPNTARALLLSALTAHPDARVLLSSHDRRRLLGDDPDPTSYPHSGSRHPETGRDTGPAARPSAPGDRRVRVESNLDAVLNEVEADIVTRFRVLEESAGRVSVPPLVVITTVPADTRRLQMIADLGAGLGVVVIILGGWPAGITCYVTRDGRVSDARGPGVEAWDLDGLTLFSAGSRDTREMLSLLSTVPARHRPADPSFPHRTASSGTQASRLDGDIPTTALRRQSHNGADSAAAATPSERTRPTAAHDRAEQHVDDRADRTLIEEGDVAHCLDPDSTLTQSPPGGIARRLSHESDPLAPAPSNVPDITAAAQPPVTADGDLEILASSHPVAHGARLRPPAMARPHRAAVGEPLSGEVEDTPAPSREHGASAAMPTSATSIADGAADTARALITIYVLGALRVQWHPETGQEREITGSLQPRTQELLVLLALHPGGTTRDTLVSTLWGQDPPARPTNALHTALARMRRDVAEATAGAVTDLALVDNGHYRLDPAVVHVDYWRFEKAMVARRAAATDAERIAAYREVVDSYGGPLAEGMSKLEWSEPAREAIRRDAIDAVAALARALHDEDPQQTLDLLEVARAFDPHNELLYRDIMRLQERLGLIDAIPRTLTLLTTRLTEVNSRPSEHAIGLATRLRQRHDDNPSVRSTAATRWRR